MATRGSFGGGVPAGPATGDLSGNYPNPTVVGTHLSSALPVAQGGTGSTTENFVDLTNVQTITGNKTFSGTLTIAAPVNSTDAATKAYADGISAGVSVKASVAAATTTALPANIYNNGSSGIGATLTANAVGVLVVDGYTVLLNDRLIIKNEAAPANNGIYTVTTLGTAGVAYVLTRATDMNTPTTVIAAEALINNGTINAKSSWIVTGSGPYVVGTTAINWTQFTSPGTISAGTGITVVGSTVSLTTPVSPANLPLATSSALGVVQLNGDLGNTATSPQVVSTHLASALPLAQGGTAATTAAGARTSLGLGTSSTANIDVTPTDIANLGVQAAGGTGQVADAGHVHTMPRLDQINAPTASVSMNNQKITNQANGTATTDGATFGQIPTTLPPSGAATGDLTGTYPAPTLSATTNVETIIRANRLEQMAAPLASVSMNNQKIINVASGIASTDAANFGQIPSSLPPTGPATGDLTGTYPAPTLANTSNVKSVVQTNRLDQMAAPTASVSMNSQKLTNLANGTASTDGANFGQIPTTLPPSGAATGDLTGTYPAPTLSNTANVQSVVRTNRLDQMASPTAAVSMNSQKLTNLANATLSTDAPNFGQVVPITGGTMTGSLKFNYSNYNNYDAAYFDSTALTTGIIAGGIMSANVSQPNKVDITAMTGLIVDYTDPANPVVKEISTSAQTAIALTSTSRVVTWWMVDTNGSFIQQGTQPTPTQRRANIQLGITAYNSTSNTIFNVQTTPVISRQPTNQLYDLMYSLGTFSINGNAVSANGANLQWNKSSGSLFSPGFNYAQVVTNPHIVSSPGTVASSFRYATQLSGSQSLTQTTSIDVGHFDSGGVITAIPGGSNTCAIHRVFQFATNLISEQFAVQYGQATYSSLSAAQGAIGLEPFVVNPDFTGIGVLIGYIIATKSATALNNAAQAVFVQPARFATP